MGEILNNINKYTVKIKEEKKQISFLLIFSIKILNKTIQEILKL